MNNRRWRQQAAGMQFKLPPDLIQRIALFISSSRDWFRYLDAFHGTNTLGNLEILWQLARLHYNSNDFWPELHIYSLDEAMVEAIRAVSMYYRVVHFHHVYDLDLLERCVTPMSDTTFELHQCPQHHHAVTLPLSEWYAKLPTLPISHLTWSDDEFDANPIEGLLAVLGRMPRLRSLNLDFAAVPSVAAVWRFVKQSSLTDFSMKNIRTPTNRRGDYMDEWLVDVPDPVMNTTLVDHLTFWLHHQPVQSLQLANWTFELTPASTHELYDALWHCSTMKKLSFREMRLPHFIPPVMFDVPIQIVELELFDCALDTTDFEALANGLRRSKVEMLNVGCNVVEPKGIVAIADCLSDSSIRVLNLIATNLEETGCKALARALPNSHLVELHLGMNGLTNGALLHVVDALRSSEHLRKLGLQWNAITMSGAIALTHMLGMRKFVLEVVDLRNNRIDEADEALLKTLVDSFDHVKRMILTKRDRSDRLA
ncbi:unnamed protein product [Aphanomyces euteiches]|uniref:F-box domain-containing protein n=1 Tax=Aphanomyces euteiches TaxID=100861 RepID=A0A6G0X1V9_9STRA|nr:hypothetical protein Ae201684_009327 [Aphanomyces euteiches]KAH9070451.1 hypothetical protein Ae201684P_002809 [Aphanomyces euteiches]KAH9141906.1 hypothetical protein AeRB84_013979 [Aphanomyces euteiches]